MDTVFPTVDIEGLTVHGLGTGMLNGRLVGVAQTIPGDRVKVRLVGKKYGMKIGKLVERVALSPMRTEPICTHYPDCGGCQFIDVPYQRQLALKSTLFASGFEPWVREVIRPIIPAQSSTFYRNKMEFSFGLSESGAVSVGLKRRGKFDQVVPISTCFLQSPQSNDVLGAVTTYFGAHPVSVWNHFSHTGILRYLTIRESKSRPEMVLNFVVSEPCQDILRPLADQLMGQFPFVTSVLMSVQDTVSDTAITDSFEILSSRQGLSKSIITETLGHLHFQISPHSFFQVNPLQAKVLYDCVREAAQLTGQETVLDLYCGTGSIGLYLADLAKEVIGIEEIPQAIEDAKRNQHLNGITNARFICGNVRLILKETPFHHADVLIVDPPRSGMAPKALKRALEIKAKKLIYVSCNPATFLENLPPILQAGYRLTSLQPVDMFPNTLHVECVGVFLNGMC